MGFRVRRCGLLSIVLTSMCAHAQQPGDIVRLIHQRDFPGLERYFNGIEASFERGQATEFALLDAYKPLYMKNDELAADLLAWTTAHPQSYAAHLARGTYYRKLGELNRGPAWAKDLPPETIAYMTHVFGTAESELKTALPLTQKPFLAVLNLLNIAQYRGDDLAADRYLSEGNRLQPKNLLVRARYLNHLKPRWGGSYEAMSDFVARCQTVGLDGHDLSVLSAMINDDKGSIAELAGDLAEARKQYALALTTAAGASQRLKSDYLKDSEHACRKGLVGGVECR